MLKFNELKTMQHKTFEVKMEDENGMIVTPIKGIITANAEDVVYDLLSSVENVDNPQGDIVSNMMQLVVGHAAIDVCYETIMAISGLIEQINQFSGQLGMTEAGREAVIRETFKEIVKPIVNDYINKMTEQESITTP